MQLKLTPSYYLTQTDDGPRVVHRQTGVHYGPDDVAQLYPSWGLQPVRQSVRRAVAALKLSEEDQALVSSFVGPGRPTADAATGHIHLRVSMERKNAYVAAAKPRPLAEWCFEHLDKAADYEPPAS